MTHEIINDIMDEVYTKFHYLVTKFYEQNKIRIKRSFIDSNSPQV